MVHKAAAYSRRPANATAQQQLLEPEPRLGFAEKLELLASVKYPTLLPVSCSDESSAAWHAPQSDLCQNYKSRILSKFQIIYIYFLNCEVTYLRMPVTSRDEVTALDISVWSFSHHHGIKYFILFILSESLQLSVWILWKE